MNTTKSTFLALVAVLLSPMAANADFIEYTVLNLSNEGDPVTNTYAGTGYAGVYGGQIPEVFNGIFGLEFDFSRTLIQVDISGLAGTNITNALLDFFLVNGNGNLEDMAITSFTADGVIEYSYDSPDNLGQIIVQSLGPGANSFNITGLLADAVASGSDWLGLHLQTLGPAGNFQWTPANRNGNPDNALVRLAVTFAQVPEPGTLALLGLGLAGMGLARRRKKV